ncbi:putative Trafficking protein particle complex subunit 12 [Hypsibius exemplaris]|uniref:Trafficking protein particle complex subunit 12 n=1 Tax=Hypsibius exemplaris TaxID=2072580 RepID=A0A1W0WTZ1_HYPEX|nr:putative Trafficking protein particle complex subunit 12 [Hypsibius exemplaris]
MEDNFQGSAPPPPSIQMDSAVYSISHSAKDFYASVGTVDETAVGGGGGGGVEASVADFRARSNTPSTITVNSLPRIPSKSGLGNLISSVVDAETSLKNLMLDGDGDVQNSIRSAWVPSERTSGALAAIASSVPASDFIGADQLSKAGIMSDKLFVNPAFELSMRFVGTIPPPLLSETPEQMIASSDVRRLLAKGFYSSAANVSAKLLYAFEQGYGRAGHVSKHTPQSLMLWMYRIAALTMLEQVELAAKELEAFGDLDHPDLYLEYYNQTSTEKVHGSMVPFPLRLLHARLPQRLGNPKATLERLFIVKDKIETLLKNASEGRLPPAVTSDLQPEFLRIWQRRRVTTLYHLVAAAVQCEDFDAATGLLRLLLKLSPDRAAELWHSLGLLYCHIGTPRMAKICFAASEKEGKKSEYFTALHRALLTVCESSPVQAMDVYGQMMKQFPRHPAVVNAIAIGHFYAGRMTEAMSFLESYVLGEPRIFLTEQSVRNLVAMYELQNIQVLERKLRLLSLMCQYIPDGHGVDVLKLAE